MGMTLVDQIERKDIGGFLEVEIIREGKHGPRVIARRISHNLIVNTGKRQLWRIASGLSTNVFDQGRIGTSGAAATSAQVNVLTPITTAGGGESLVTVDSRSLEAGTRTHQWVWSYLNQNTAPGGSALMRTVFTAVAKTENDKLKLTYRSRIT
ncbi:hypothetical protein LCGC14_0724300 [marine sediment metagenome]|uniref:Uncharacterized protein n=1 Tax=marine sediment metagenome TaxID=412755 RepID=A0A0F9TIT8_9ZZZZ